MKQNAGVVCLIAALATALATGSVSAQCELQTIWSPEGGPEHYFGFAAAGSASMDVLVVGEFGQGQAAGAAYIYRRIGDVWELETMLVAPDGPIPFNQFGRSIAMSADLDGDCTVGASDLLILLSNWG